MIHYLTRNELDVLKYNACISKAINSRIYAYSWYLDIVSDNWDVLILDDYRAVMPLPWRKKYFIKYIYMLPWVQQLGVFYQNENDQKLINDFINIIPKKFKFVELLLNSNNCIENRSFSKRTNYTLSLNKPYNSIYKNYKKGRKSDVKIAQSSNQIINQVDNPLKLIELFIDVKSKEVKRDKNDYQILSDLVKKLKELNKIKIYETFNQQNELLGGAIFLIDANRITYLFSAVNEQGRKEKTISFIIDTVIKEYANSSFVFDFEGSMVDSLASFFRSFGAELEYYYSYKKYTLWG